MTMRAEMKINRIPAFPISSEARSRMIPGKNHIFWVFIRYSIPFMP